MSKKVDVEKPVKITIEITGDDVDTCTYGLGDVLKALDMGKTSGEVDYGSSEGYRFSVVNLEAEEKSTILVDRNAAIQAIYKALRKDREIWLDPEDAMEMATEVYESGRNSDG